MRIPLSLAVLVAALVVPSAAPAGPLTQDPCAGTSTSSTWARPGGVLENLLFADDHLWVSAGAAVVRFAPDGTEGGGLGTVVQSAGGLVHDVDGLVDAAKPGWIYAGSGNSLFNAITRTPAASVLRFDPGAPDATVELVVDGLTMPNGMALDAGGNLYVSNDFDRALMKITPGGAVSRFADVWGTNGLVISPDGATMHAAVTFDQRSPIARISMSDPTDLDHQIQLSAGAVSLEPALHPDGDPSAPLLGVKGLDDMTRDADGILYVAANGTGELIRVHPATGAACLIATGLQNPSSVRIAPEDSAFADGIPASLDLYVTEFSGDIERVVFTPAP